MIALEDFEKFLKKVKKTNGDKLLEKTKENYVYYIREYIQQYSDILGDITYIDVENEQNKEILNKVITLMNKNLKTRSNIVHYSALRLFLIFIGLDPKDELIRTLDKPNKNSSALTSHRMLQSKMLTAPQLLRLFNEVDDEYKLIFSFLFDTAMRRNEFLNVKWGDIQFLKKPDSNIYAEVYVIGKSQKARTVFLTKTTVDLLIKLKGEKTDDKLKEKIFVFYQDDNKTKPYVNQESHLYKRVKKIIKEILGVEKGIHSFRHSKLSSMAEQGADILKIARYGAHSQTSTSEIYVKSASHVGRNAFKDFDKGIEGDDNNY